MNPTRKRRLILIVFVLAATVLAVSLTLWALAQNMNYLFTPSQVLAGQAARYQAFRLGGMVKAGSIVHDPHSLKVRFLVVDADGAIMVHYDGILPDLFRDNQSVIVTGHRQGRDFIASEVLAKHDETYMPKELKEAMKRAHAQAPASARAAQP